MLAAGSSSLDLHFLQNRQAYGTRMQRGKVADVEMCAF
jgi:hypothetical protein